MPLNTVVYYPHLWPRPEWLKLAALCWDRVYLVGVRPGWGTLTPPPEVVEIDKALGGLLDTSLAFRDIVDNDIAEKFKRWVGAHEDRLRAEMSTDGQPLFRMYDGKFEQPDPTVESLRDWLVDRGLARIEEPDEGEYAYEFAPGEYQWSEVGASAFVQDTVVHLPKDIALQYFSLVAAKAAAEGGRDMAADDAVFTDIVFHDLRGLTGMVASSTLEAYLPEGFADLAPDKLADLRAGLAAGRLKYQATVQELTSELAKVASEGELATIRAAVEEVAQERVEETERSYRRANLKTVVEGVGMTLTPPAVVTSVASALGIGLFGPVGVAAAISLFGAGALLAHIQARAERSSSPWSYVLDVAQRTQRAAPD
jgi:hypothetical protein